MKKKQDLQFVHKGKKAKNTKSGKEEISKKHKFPAQIEI